MELERLHLQMRVVEDANDLGELRLAAWQLHGDAATTVAAQVAESRQQLCQPVPGVRIGGRHLDGRAADLGLEPGRGALGDDPAVVDDSDPIGQRVRLLQVLRGEEHGHPLVMGQPRHLLPQRRAALRVEAGGRLVEEEDPRRVDERQCEIEASLHSARVTADAAVGRLGQADSLEQLLSAPPAVGAGSPCSVACSSRCSRPVRIASSAASCSAAPITALTCAPCRAMSKPPTVARPLVGGSSVVSISTVVDLPAPFGPRKP